MGERGHGRGDRPEGIAPPVSGPAAGRRAARVASLVAALVVVLAEAPVGGAETPPEPGTGAEAAAALRAAPAPEGAVVVRLAFGAAGDLDLYVTGPDAETVYFANSPSKLGGRLAADHRCDAPAPRVETVVFPDLRPGAYRVGVDFPERCEGGRGALDFALDVRSPGGRREHRGRIAPGVFEPVVLEWVEPEPSADADADAGSAPPAPGR